MKCTKELASYLATINWDWSVIFSGLTALAGIVVANTAWRGLNAWKHQKRTEIQWQFISNLMDAAHEYMGAMGKPLYYLGIIEIGIRSYSEVERLKNNNTKNAGAIEYIRKCGKETQTTLFEYLSDAQIARAKLMSLATKGQILGFRNYSRCYNVCATLSHLYGQIEAVAGMIGSDSLNWENEQVQVTLDKVLSVRSEAISNNLQLQSEELLKYASTLNQELFGT